MSIFGRKIEKLKTAEKNPMFDYSSFKVIILAGIIIILAVAVAGATSYAIARNAIVNKLKDRDFRYITQSISAKIDKRIAKAKETSLIMAADPWIKKWVVGKEKDSKLGQLAKDKITYIANNFNYDNAFIVSAITHHYWAEGGRLIDTVSAEDPDDSWFFNTIESKKPISISIDYNNERKNTYAFINAIMRNAERPVAIVGIGINFKDISKEFQSYKFGKKSNMWLIDNKGSIYISEDTAQSGEKISKYLPHNVVSTVTLDSNKLSKGYNVIEYKSEEGILYDLVYMQLQSIDWTLVLQIPRSESVSFIHAIKLYIILSCALTIILLVFLFYFVSKKIADPFKRSMELTRKMENIVKKRTKELKEKNRKITDSIEYAKMIQESILPTSKELNHIFKKYFLIWKPRDIVGGDFYHIKQMAEGILVIVGDCTGHGVPGALMTMTVNSILNNLLENKGIIDPVDLLRQLNISIKQSLYGGDSSVKIDDGLDAGVVFIPKNDNFITFAGAKISLYVNEKGSLKKFKGDRKSIGYKRNDNKYVFTLHKVPFNENCTYYITTDGFLHQNGGDKDLPFGRSRFEELLRKTSNNKLLLQKDIINKKLNDYMKNKTQRDDITVLGFKPTL